MAASSTTPGDEVSPALQNQADQQSSNKYPDSERDSAVRPPTPPPPGLPPVLSPPYWQVKTHHRAESLASVASTINNRPAPIRLEDNTEIYEELGDDVRPSNGVAKGHAAGLQNGARNASVTSPPAKSPLWARVVHIDGHTLVAGAVRGVGDYVVWTCNVDTLDGGTIVLRKRYSEFVALRHELEATFPKSKASLPALPPKSIVKRFQPRFLERRRAGLEFFLNCVLLNPEFAGSAILKEFVFR